MAERKPPGALVASRDDADVDDFDLWIEEEAAEDPRLAGAIADAECRANLVHYLIQCRHEKGLSQAAVAEVMETTQSAVSELEGGGTDPRLSTLQRYARALDCMIRIHVNRVQPFTFTTFLPGPPIPLEQMQFLAVQSPTALYQYTDLMPLEEDREARQLPAAS